MADPQLRPFNPGEYITNADGTISTERSRTVMDPYGQYMNVPSLWKDENGKVYDLGQISDDELSNFASYYELKAKQPWKRFKSVDEAVSAAKQRSSEGGAFQGSGLFGGLLSDTPKPDDGLGGLLGVKK
jgi:hypothetical protein